MQSLDAQLFIYFCNEILQDMIYCNFLQCNNAQNVIWSSLLPRCNQEYSTEIYYVFFWDLIHFLCILEFYMNFWNLNENEKSKNPVHSIGRVSTQGCSLLVWPSGESSPAGPHRGPAQVHRNRSPRPVRWRWRCSWCHAGRRGALAGAT
jgi:hypothetical protein